MPARHSQEVVDKSIELYLSGMSASQVAIALNIAKRTVVNYAKLAGVTRTVKESSYDKRQELSEDFYVSSIYFTENNEFDPDIFKTIDTEEKAYWLGFIYADGCVSHVNRGSEKLLRRFNFTLKDKGHVERFARFIGKGDKVREIKVGEYLYYCVAFTNERFVSNLFNKGVVPRKSLVLTFPSDNIVPYELLRHFVRGYFDGDGSFILRNRSYHGCSNVNVTFSLSIVGTKEFIDSVQLYIVKETGVAETKLFAHGENTYEYRKEGFPCLEVLKFLYYGSSIFLDRKFDKFIAALYSDV